MKKGATTIAPKKAKAKEHILIQKKLQRAINYNAELEVKQKASKDLTAFKLLKKEKKPEDKEKKSENNKK
ncbi:hypothetical protein Pmani_024503 [Petrolisthes manimaculis]|uniref:Uncharacterized protein n=1 Tax=Petrolisthes manimaculis TaxID=1843537 RepID=A0AAE1P9M8_9EUCA|nr:hypothetical protein Pmani_024503 [Petrolisthes manimaculis]